MLVFSNLYAHVTSAAFAQARLRSTPVCSPYLRDTVQLRLTSSEIINF
jgi:hypothetical protein